MVLLDLAYHPRSGRGILHRRYPSFQLDGMRSAEHHVMRIRHYIEVQDKSVLEFDSLLSRLN